MLLVRVHVGDIQYERSTGSLVPLLYRKCRHLESENFIIRLFQKLGNDAGPVLQELLEELPQERKNELLCALLQYFGPELSQMLNRALSGDRPYFQTGGIAAAQEEGGLCITFSAVSIDCGALMQNPVIRDRIADTLPHPLGRLFGDRLAGRMVRRGAGYAASLAESVPGAGEKAILSILEQPRAQEALLHFAEDVLEKNGLYLHVQDLQAEPDPRPAQSSEKPIFRLTRELEDALLDSAAACLRKRPR